MRFGRGQGWLLVLSWFALAPLASEAAPPLRMHWQGLVTDSAGAPLSGPVNLQVGVWTAPSGGAALYLESFSGAQAPIAIDGVVSIQIGTGTPLVGVLDPGNFDLPNRYLELTVNGEPLTPRQPFASVPYAFNASNASALSGISPAGWQRTVTGFCTAGFSIRSITQDGNVTCEADDVGTGDVTGVTAGSGLSGGGTSGELGLAVDTAVVQTRVAGSCAVGNSIRAIAANGTVTCEPDDNSGGDITGISTSLASGLDGGTTSGNATLSVDPTDFNAVPIELNLLGISAIPGTTFSTIRSQSITVPVAGRVVAIGASEIHCTNCGPANNFVEIEAGLTTVETTAPSNFVPLEFRTDTSLNPRISFTVFDVFSVSAGTTTVYYQARKLDAADSASLRTPRLLVFFVPN